MKYVAKKKKYKIVIKYKKIKQKKEKKLKEIIYINLIYSGNIFNILLK